MRSLRLKIYAISALIVILFLCNAASANTVDYNDPSLPKEVNRLREFRDTHLKKYRAGREFISYYYKYGPSAAEAIKERDRLRSLVRLSLLPLMYAGKHFDTVLLLLKLFCGFLILALFWSIYMRFTAGSKKFRRINIIKQI